jgi:WW domain-containing oxidoreductase
VDCTQVALDMLFLSAGIASAGVNSDGSVPLSEDDVELVFATNHLGHHLLFRLLEPLLEKSQMPRVVLTSTFPYIVATDLETLNSVSGTAQNLGYLYGQSKLAQILFAKFVAARNLSIYINTFHPGAVNTLSWQKNPMFPEWLKATVFAFLQQKFMWNATEGALTMLYLGVATDKLQAKNIRGQYFHPQVHPVVNEYALDQDLQRRLWNFCEELVQDFL